MNKQPKHGIGTQILNSLLSRKDEVNENGQRVIILVSDKKFHGSTTYLRYDAVVKAGNELTPIPAEPPRATDNEIIDIIHNFYKTTDEAKNEAERVIAELNFVRVVRDLIRTPTQQATGEEILRCCDCKKPLPKDFKHRCPECYDEIYFPGINDGGLIPKMIKKLCGLLINQKKVE